MPTPPAALLATLIEALGPDRATLQRADGSQHSAQGPGGGLEAGLELHGAGPVAASLDEGDRLVLEDGGLVMELTREGHRASLRVRWPQGPSLEEQILLTGVARLRPMAPAGGGSVGPRVPDLLDALHDPSQVLDVVDGRLHRAMGPALPAGASGRVPAVAAGSLGDPAFRVAHGLQGNLIAGAMAGGIGSAEMVIAMARAGLIGFFGSGGLDLDRVEAALQQVSAALGPDAAWGFNLLHNPVEPEVEERTVDLYLRYGLRRVSASAYMALTPAIVRYRLNDIHAVDGKVVCPNHVFAKVSRPEVAEPFLRPAPKRMIDELVAAGHLTQAQARLAALVPIAEDVTAEADSGGHTDRRPLLGLLPVFQRLRDRVAAEEGYAERGIFPRIGAAGGLGDPASVHAAFAMGAAYVLTGSVNQSCVEAGTSHLAKVMVATAGIADCTTGPAPDMFELGAHVQVLGQGTMYAQRGKQLYDLYRRYDDIDQIPAKDREKVEKTIFRRSLDEVWTETRAYWAARDPRQVERAEADGHHKMALVFRWYLGMTSRWARVGDPDRRRDYQIWCGPAMGLFNDWVQGSALDPLDARKVGEVSWALLHGAAALRRVEVARALGVALPPGASTPPPRLRR